MNQNDQQVFAGVIAIMIVVGVIALTVGLAIHAFICWNLSNCFKRIPQQYRQQEPGMVWLLMIPCFSLVWNFFVYPKLSSSFQAYFRANGQPNVGDCGQSLATALCVLNLTLVIPYLNALTGTAALVILIIYLLKANELKNLIPVDMLTGGEDFAKISPSSMVR